MSKTMQKSAMPKSSKASAPTTSNGIGQKSEILAKIDEITAIKTAESRLNGLKILNKLSEKVSFLREKQDDLNMFIASSDETDRKIILQNAQGALLEISNTQVTHKVLDVVLDELNRVTEEAEKEFLAFSI